MQHNPITDQQLDEIAGRAAGLYEYATGLDAAWQAEADQLAGEDVPALLAEVRRLRDRETALATLTERWERVAAMHTAGHPEGAVVDLSPFQREEAGKAHSYRKAVSDVRQVLATGRIPHDLMTDAELDPASAVAVSGGEPVAAPGEQTEISTRGWTA